MSSPAVVLRYFAVCGRAQALRHALVDSGTSSEDLRLSLVDWSGHRNDPAFAGPHRALPTLSWGVSLVAETLPIASFLAKRLGHYEGLGDAVVAAWEAIVSSAYIDVMLRLIDVIRADLLHPGAEPARSLGVALPRIIHKLEILDAALADRTFIGGDRPTNPDFFVAEAFEAMRYVAGSGHEAWLAGRLPRSSTLALRLRERPALASAWENRPPRFTARPDEDQVIARLQASGSTGLGELK